MQSFLTLMITILFTLPSAALADAQNRCAWSLTKGRLHPGRIPYVLETLPRVLTLTEDRDFRRLLSRELASAFMALDFKLSASFQRQEFAEVVATMMARGQLFKPLLAQCATEACPKALVLGLYAVQMEAFLTLQILEGYVDASKLQWMAGELRDDVLEASIIWLRVNNIETASLDRKLAVTTPQALGPMQQEINDDEGNIIIDPNLGSLGYYLPYSADLYPGLYSILRLSPDWVAHHEVDHHRFKAVGPSNPYMGQMTTNTDQVSFPLKLVMPPRPSNAPRPRFFSLEELHAYGVSLIFLSRELKKSTDFQTTWKVMAGIYASAAKGEQHAYVTQKIVPEVLADMRDFSDSIKQGGAHPLTVERPNFLSGTGKKFPTGFFSRIKPNQYLDFRNKSFVRTQRPAFVFQGSRYTFESSIIRPHHLPAVTRAGFGNKQDEVYAAVELIREEVFEAHAQMLLPIAATLEESYEAIRVDAMAWFDTHEDQYLQKILIHIATLSPYLIHPVGW